MIKTGININERTHPSALAFGVGSESLPIGYGTLGW